MRLLFVTDTHIRGTSPQNRKDNFPQTLKSKLKEVVSLAKEHRVDAILHGGDFFDSPAPSLSVCSEFIPIFKGMEIPLYGIAGNHDLFGHNPETLDRTMLGFLSRLGVIRLLSKDDPVYFEKNGIRIQLTGQHYHYDMDRRSPEMDYVVKKEDCHYAIHLVHGMLYDKKLPPGVPHTIIDNVLATEADITLCGHNHLGFKDTNIEGKYFLNPGGLVRLSNHPAEMNRRPKVILLEFTAEGPSYSFLHIRSALSGKDVLDRTAIENSVFQEEKFEEFVKGIRSSGDYQSLVLEEIIQSLADQKGVSKEVREGALMRIAKVRQGLGV